MPIKVYESNDVFVPSEHGLKVGDYVDLICIGGGASGDYTYLEQAAGGAYLFAVSDSVEGGESSFGSLFSSSSGYKMGIGGNGSITNDPITYYGGHGAGGYLPGIPIFGGNGGSGNGLSGGTSINSQYINSSGPGNKGATGKISTYDGNGGNGYGAGAGAHSIGPKGETYIPPDSKHRSKGGDSGKLSIGSAKITSMDTIAVTVGRGGINERDANQHGAPGVVIVCW